MARAGSGSRPRWHSEDYKRKARDRYYRAQYGITEVEYVALLQAQDGRCGICNEQEQTMYEGKPRRLAVDHDHETGEVRGLLCSNCNRAIGMMGDDAERLRAAARWVE